MALKMIILIAITMALTIVLTTTNLMGDTNKNNPPSEDDEMIPHFPTSRASLYLVKPKTRVSRFLAEQKEKPNPRAADHCKNDDELCYVLEGKNGTCCNNKCMDLSMDDKNCGACKRKCDKYTDSCCGGKCVDLAYDKRNCGTCGFKCKQGKYCVYGTCDYA